MKIRQLFWIALGVPVLALMVTGSTHTSKILAAESHDEKGHQGHGSDSPTAKGGAKENTDSHLESEHTGPRSKKKTTDNHPPEEVENHQGHGTEHSGHEAEQAIKISEAEMKQSGIEVGEAESGQLQNELALPGVIAMNEDRKAHILPRVPGVVREVRKGLGDVVEQGEVLAVIESGELAEAKAEYLAAREKTALANAKFVREEGLWKKKISAEQEYLEARQELAEHRIALRSAEQKLHVIGLTHEQLDQLPKSSDLHFTRFEITAPFNSTVIEKHITLGEMAKDDADVFVLADLSTVWVNLTVYQKDLPRIKKGQRVLITLGQEEGERAEGRIAYVQPVVKEETRTATATVFLPNPEGNWRPGMFVSAKVLSESATAPIVVPQSAIQTIENKTVVFVRTKEGFEPRPVAMGRATNGNMEITSGLSRGERFAVKGTFTLKAQLSKGAFGDGHAH